MVTEHVDRQKFEQSEDSLHSTWNVTATEVVIQFYKLKTIDSCEILNSRLFKNSVISSSFFCSWHSLLCPVSSFNTFVFFVQYWTTSLTELTASFSLTFTAGLPCWIRKQVHIPPHLTLPQCLARTRVLLQRLVLEAVHMEWLIPGTCHSNLSLVCLSL